MPKHSARLSCWEPTPKHILDEVLYFSQIKKNDVFFDLGSGDGCVLIRAAQLYGCHTIGLEITQKLIDATNTSAKKKGVADLVEVRNKDMRKASYKKATIVYMYLPDGTVKAMFPVLQKRCQPGTKIVTLGSTHVSGAYDKLTPHKEMHIQLPDRFWKIRLWIIQ